MPVVTPLGGEVSWPLGEGVLGVVGVAPWATMEFCREFYALFTVEKDWQFPRVIADINSKLPSRGRHLQLGERDPSPFIAESIAELAAAGATVAVVVCNTAHILFDRWGISTAIPVLNIIDTVVAEAVGQGCGRAAALVSESLAKHDLYGAQAEDAGLEFHRLSAPMQHVVNDFIEQIKRRGELSEAQNDGLVALLEHLRQNAVDTVMLGCTELSVLSAPLAEEGYRVVDSNAALARAAYQAVIKPVSEQSLA